jgi:hypothetical protein
MASQGDDTTRGGRAQHKGSIGTSGGAATPIKRDQQQKTPRTQGTQGGAAQQNPTLDDRISRVYMFIWGFIKIWCIISLLLAIIGEVYFQQVQIHETILSASDKKRFLDMKFFMSFYFWSVITLCLISFVIFFENRNVLILSSSETIRLSVLSGSLFVFHSVFCLWSFKVPSCNLTGLPKLKKKFSNIITDTTNRQATEKAFNVLSVLLFFLYINGFILSIILIITAPFLCYYLFDFLINKIG